MIFEWNVYEKHYTLKNHISACISDITFDVIIDQSNRLIHICGDLQAKLATLNHVNDLIQ
jgi:hypothetical protein